MHPVTTHRNYLSQHGFKYPHTVDADRRGGTWLQRTFRRWKEQRMVARLRAMDDHLLQDIGIHRSEIPRIVREFSNRELGMSPVADRAANDGCATAQRAA